MSAPDPAARADIRTVELATLRGRAARAEAALTRVLEVCSRAEKTAPSQRMVVRVADVRAAIAGKDTPA